MATTITTRQHSAETLIIEMDSVQSELESASDSEMFESCKAHLAGLKSDIEALGFQAERWVNGWRLIATQQPVEETPCGKRQESTLLFYAQDNMGLYACVRSASAKGRTYRVSIEEKWLYSELCDCASPKDCWHRLEVDRALDSVRPTFREQCEGKGATREKIASLLYAGAAQTQAAA